MPKVFTIMDDNTKIRRRVYYQDNIPYIKYNGKLFEVEFIDNVPVRKGLSHITTKIFKLIGELKLKGE